MLLYLGAQESADASLAQLDRVTGYEPVGQGFESLTTRQQKAQRHQPLGFLFSRRHDAEPHTLRLAQACSFVRARSEKAITANTSTKVGSESRAISQTPTASAVGFFVLTSSPTNENVARTRATIEFCYAKHRPCLREHKLNDRPPQTQAQTWVQSPLRRGHMRMSYQ